MKRTFLLLIVMVLLLDAGCATMNDAKAYNNQGLTYFKMRQYDQAISDFNKALEINPRDVTAYNNRGSAYLEKGLYDKAWEDVHKAED